MNLLWMPGRGGFNSKKKTVGQGGGQELEKKEEAQAVYWMGEAVSWRGEKSSFPNKGKQSRGLRLIFEKKKINLSVTSDRQRGKLPKNHGEGIA